MGTGRPTDYKPEYDKLAYNYCLLGAIDKDLANNLEVSEATLNNWKIAHPSFLESIKDGRERADFAVTQSLHKRAMGYTHKVQKAMQYQGEPIIVEIEEEVPPDTTAQIFWQKNRQPKYWRDKQDVVLTAEVEPDMEAVNARINELLSTLTPEEKLMLTDK